MSSVHEYEQPPQPQPIGKWFQVTFDQQQIRLQVAPPGGEPWSEQFGWSSIERIVFKAEGFGLSDGLYLFTAGRPESYAIPIEVNGGSELWAEILQRGFFDPALAIQAASSPGGFFVWPPVE